MGLTRSVTTQAEYFEVLSDKFSFKKWPKLMMTFWVKVKSIILLQKLPWVLFGQLYKNLGYFLFQHLVTLLTLLTRLHIVVGTSIERERESVFVWVLVGSTPQHIFMTRLDRLDSGIFEERVKSSCSFFEREFFEGPIIKSNRFCMKRQPQLVTPSLKF